MMTALWIGSVFISFFLGARWGFNVACRRAGEMIKHEFSVIDED